MKTIIARLVCRFGRVTDPKSKFYFGEMPNDFNMAAAEARLIAEGKLAPDGSLPRLTDDF